MIMKHPIKTYAWLLASNLFISAFTFGGGYIVVPMIRRFFVVKKQFFTEEELVNMAAIAQSTPGAIAINLSALAGYRTAGIAGAVISCIAAIIPPLIILGFVSAFYKLFVSNVVVTAILKGMEAGVAALMADLVTDMCSMILKKKSFFYSIMIPLSFVANYFFGINVALLLAVCCFLCVLHLFSKRRKDQ